VTDAAIANVSPSVEIARSQKRAFSLNLTGFFVTLVLLTAIYIGARFYQQAYGFTKGLDSTAPDFSTYWLTFFKIETVTLYGACVASWIYLFVTRDRNMAALQPAEELRRYFILTAWLVTYSFTIFWTGSFFADGDGVWHQTVLRDTPLTPSHIVLFYGTIPMYLFMGVGSFIYAMTRIPAFCRGISLMHVFAVTGPFIILPNLGFNEWGHAYWMTEEIFSHPLHWGFVVLGWNALALAGVLMQILARFRELFPIVFKLQPAS
jgi:methane/ammonia monooxygenase subunit C